MENEQIETAEPEVEAEEETTELEDEVAEDSLPPEERARRLFARPCVLRRHRFRGPASELRV